jgi:uncharacterized protein (TIGR00297 family)
MGYAYGLAASILVAGLACWRGSLTRGGAVAAVVVGALVAGGGGWGWGVLLLTFFLTSNALSRLGAHRKQSLAEIWAKGARRDAGQVLANGGLAALLATVHALHPSPYLAGAFAGALAAVTADTWATEIGVLGSAPRMIHNGQRVSAGTSGAVSLAGTAAAGLGAAAIGVLATWLSLAGALPAHEPPLGLGCSVAAGGLAGALADSLLGATLQAGYHCVRCDKPTEKRRHGCGTVTRRTSGLSWLDNDGVNFLASAVGAAVAALLMARGA